MITNYKAAIRKIVRNERANLSLNYKNIASIKIFEQINSLISYKNSKCIAIYSSINGEIDLKILWKEAMKEGKICYFPIANVDLTLSFFSANYETVFKKNKYEILEPETNLEAAVSIDKLDIMFMPLVAFDKQCNRIGMGLGYYDRTLISKRPKNLIGVAYQFQLIDFIETQYWDIPLDAVITPQNIYWR